MTDVKKMGTLAPDPAVQPMDCPNIYFNGVEVGVSLSDISVFATINGKRQYRLHMSFTTAKTFAIHLVQAIKILEQAADHDIMTMEDIGKAFENIKQPRNDTGNV